MIFGLILKPSVLLGWPCCHPHHRFLYLSLLPKTIARKNKETLWQILLTPIAVANPKGHYYFERWQCLLDTNANGDIFGGWIMSQMDMGGAILAKEIAHGRVVTVAVDSMNFIRPAFFQMWSGCYGDCLSVGRTSIKSKWEVWVKKVSGEPLNERYCVTEATFTFLQLWMIKANRALFRVKITPELTPLPINLINDT